MLSRYMRITHRIDDFLFELFPGTESDTEKLTDAIKRYYTTGPFEPSVDVDDNFIHITIDTERIETDKERFTRLVSLAEKEKYDEAKELALELIEQAPNVSEYHRILGQIYSETGEQKEVSRVMSIPHPSPGVKAQYQLVVSVKYGKPSSESLRN